MQKRINIQYSLNTGYKGRTNDQRLLVWRSKYCLVICFIFCLSFTMSCSAQTPNDKESPLLSLLSEYKTIAERQAAKRSLQETLQEDINNLPPIIGIKWVPDVKFLITCISPARRQTDFENPYLKLYAYRPDENRLTLKSQGDIFVLPSYHAITRYVADNGTVFFFSLRAPEQLEPLSPVYRLVHGDLFVQPIRTIFQSTVLENAFFAVISNGDNETQKLSIWDGKKQLKSQIKLPITLPNSYLDIELVRTASTMSGIIGEPIKARSGTDWRFNKLWFYQLPFLDNIPNELFPHEFREIESLSWLKEKDAKRKENQRQIKEEVSFGLPVFGSVNEGQAFYWQHHKLSSPWEGGEILTIHKLLEWNKVGKIRLIDVFIEYHHNSTEYSWTFGRRGKLIQSSLLHIPMAYKRLNQSIKFIVAADPTGRYLLYVKGNKLIGLAVR